MRPHPNGVEPLGSLYLRGGRDARESLGDLRPLSDEVLLRVVGGLDAGALGRLACACRALYCFANHEELWRALVLQEREGRFRFAGTWKASYLAAGRRGGKRVAKARPRPQLRVAGVFSDLLFQPHCCAATPLRPEWLAVENVDRRAGLSVEDFQRQYEAPNIPVILTDQVTRWPAFGKWTPAHLQQAFAGQEVTVGDYGMRFRDYLAYMRRQTDDMPLYLFDRRFAAKAPQLAADYQVPPAFAEDLFSLLGEAARPDYRWLIMGPARSGSSFHKDPNATSAWNGVVTGAKKWILYPPHVTPPGVVASGDGADVATPVSLIEWLLNFYGATQERARARPRECTVRAGELLFVPRGWWHMALNLEESIAVTQNFVSSANLAHVLRFLASRSPELISGCERTERAGLHARFLAALRAQRPEVLQAALEEGEAGSKRKRAHGALSGLFQQEGSRPAQGGGFKFGFP